MIFDNDLKSLKRNGYLLIKNIFTEKEVIELRNKSLEYFSNDNNHFVYHNCGKVLPNAFEYFQDLRSVLNNKVVSLAKELLGNDIYYIYHSDLHYNMFNNWHRDLSDQYIDGFNTLQTFTKAKIYKIAIYLQDHSSDNRGLSLIPKSHNTFDEKNFEDELTIHPNMGDIIIFDQRLMHKGDRIDPESVEVCKWIEQNSSNIDEDKFKYFKTKREKIDSTKLSVFFGIGYSDEITKEFAKATIRRQNIQNNVKDYQISIEFKRYLNDIGLPALDLEGDK